MSRACLFKDPARTALLRLFFDTIWRINTEQHGRLSATHCRFAGVDELSAAVKTTFYRLQLRSIEFLGFSQILM